MINYEEQCEKIEELQKYADSDSSEWRETMQALCQLAHYSDYKLQEMLDKELTNSVNYIKEKAVITNQTKTYTRAILEMERK